MGNVKTIFSILVAGLFLQACQFGLDEGIIKAEDAIGNMGVNIARLESIRDIPVDHISYVKQGLIEAKPIKGTLLNIPDQRYFDFLGLVHVELSKYPERILKNDVDNIYVSGQILSEEDRLTAGFYYPGTQNIYMFPLVFDLENFSDGTTIRSTIHHEISSILLRKYRFDMIGFMALNGYDIEYWNDEAWLLKHPVASYYASGSLLNDGLLTHYSQTSPENDYNTYLEVAFAYPAIMSGYCSVHSRIKKKYEFIKKFYLGISDGFRPVFERIQC